MESREGILKVQRLYEASLNGSVESLNKLLQEDKLTLARVSTTCFNETPLHIAAMLGHVDFANLLLAQKPDLAKELDSQGFSPLHLASANGYVEMVKVLLQVNSDACIIRDEDGRTPLHLAVMKGRIDVIQELVRAKPEVAWYTLDHGETLLHLAVKHNRLEAIKLLVDFGRDDDIVNVKDNDGNTILHIATSLKQIQTIKYLLSRTRVKVNAVNENGLTALDIIEHAPRDLKAMEIRESLLNVGALRARKIPESAGCTNRVIEAGEILQAEVIKSEDFEQLPSKGGIIKKQLKKDDDGLTKKHEDLMVAASVIATMAYQAALSPPGGVWDRDSDKDNQQNFLAGQSILATNNFGEYELFWISNTLSFVSSLSIIFLLVSGLPLKRKIFIWILTITMWITITSMTFAYVVTLGTMTPYPLGRSINKMIGTTIMAWMGLCSIVILWQTTRFILWSVRNIRKLRKKRLSKYANESHSQYQENSLGSTVIGSKNLYP